MRPNRGAHTREVSIPWASYLGFFQETECSQNERSKSLWHSSGRLDFTSQPLDASNFMLRVEMALDSISLNPKRTRPNTRTYIYIYVYIYMHVCRYVYIYMCVRTSIYIYIHTCFHSYLHSGPESLPTYMILGSI